MRTRLADLLSPRFCPTASRYPLFLFSRTLPFTCSYHRPFSLLFLAHSPPAHPSTLLPRPASHTMRPAHARHHLFSPTPRPQSSNLFGRTRRNAFVRASVLRDRAEMKGVEAAVAAEERLVAVTAPSTQETTWEQVEVIPKRRKTTRKSLREEAASSSKELARRMLLAAQQQRATIPHPPPPPPPLSPAPAIVVEGGGGGCGYGADGGG